MKPFEIEFDIISEIRHGSLYNVASVSIIGNSNFRINPNNSWQDIQAWSDNSQYFALVNWDFKDSDPGFRVHIFDTRSGELIETDRISGCCHSLEIDNELNLDVEIFTLISKPNEKKQYGVTTKRIKTGYNKT